MTSGGKGAFTGRDLAVVVPTFKRPAKLANLLASLADQGEPLGRVIIVDGDTSAESVAAEFATRLSIDYVACHPPGQIRQRNLGLSKLRDTDRLVALLDDDIVALPGSIAAMLRFWNAQAVTPAAVCFNIVNGEPERYSAARALFGLTAREPGRVLRSGMTTAVSHAARDARIQWVPGGATVWRADVLRAHAHREIRARWAIAEDLIFSYRVGKSEPLFVCAAAQCRHEHVADYGSNRQDRYHGRTQTLWWYYFVASSPDLSRGRFLVTLLVRMAGKAAAGALRGDRRSLEFAAGQALAMGAILHCLASGASLVSLLEEATP